MWAHSGHGGRATREEGKRSAYCDNATAATSQETGGVPVPFLYHLPFLKQTTKLSKPVISVNTKSKNETKPRREAKVCECSRGGASAAWAARPLAPPAGHRVERRHTDGPPGHIRGAVYKNTAHRDPGKPMAVLSRCQARCWHRWQAVRPGLTASSGSSGFTRGH